MFSKLCQKFVSPAAAERYFQELAMPLDTSASASTCLGVTSTSGATLVNNIYNYISNHNFIDAMCYNYEKKFMNIIELVRESNPVIECWHDGLQLMTSLHFWQCLSQHSIPDQNAAIQLSILPMQTSHI